MPSALCSATARRAVLVSARTGEGVAALLAAVDRRLGAHDEILSARDPRAATAAS